jgi:hypothetical protein
MERCIQRLFRQHFPVYLSQRKVSLRERRAADSIMACRTAALGGHVETCPEGHVSRAHYNSCKHRSCTLCNGLLRERWLLARKAKLLDCPHYHSIFTVPHEFIPLWLYNRSRFMNLLFQGTHAALMTFLSDPKHLGAMPGLLMSFHSWGRNLSLHPHVHCLITAGGLDEAGAWRQPRRSHFLPVKALMLVFRGIMTRLLHQALEQDELVLPRDTDRFEWHKRIKATKAKAWNVHLRDRYDHAQGVACYLAKYVRGGPLRDQQLSVRGNYVVLQYRSHQTQRVEQVQFTCQQFIERFLQHVPDKSSHVVRGCGLYGNNQLARLNQARALHQQQPAAAPAFLEWQSWLSKITGVDHRYCPQCQKLMVTSLVVPRQQAPPARVLLSAGRPVQ